MNAKDPKSNIETKSREKYRLWYVYGDLAAHVLNRQRESAYHIGHRSNDGNSDIEAKIKQANPGKSATEKNLIWLKYIFQRGRGAWPTPSLIMDGIVGPLKAYLK